MTKIQISPLLYPAGKASPNGKFYIGVAGPGVCFVQYGANTPGAGGTFKVHPSARDVANQVSKKMGNGYNPVVPSQLPKAAIDAMKLKIAHSLGVHVKDITVKDDHVVVGPTRSGGSGGKPAAAPRRKKNQFPIWI